MKKFLLVAFCSFLQVGCFSASKHAAESTFSDPQVIELANAAKDGDTEKIDELLAQGVDINTVGKKGLNILYWLLVMNEETPEKKLGFRHLLESGANALQVDEDVELTPLHVSARYIDSDYLKIILETQPNIDIDFDLGDRLSPTPLMQAMAADRYENFKILLDHGADIEKKRVNGDTPLIMARGNGSWRFAYLLLENEADYNYAKDKLVWAIENLVYRPSVAIKHRGTDYRQKVIDFLREKGVEVNPWMPEDEGSSD
ncbi:MAG: ankyrin repeat domain-containing protein [Candidatus Peregrinibacteria bacterium]|nr:ankyrin repeat domain-containing protein [Candidatus Peregrinibacteria bacterium]